MNKERLYRIIAERHGVSVSEVKRDMQAAINEAYKNPNAVALAMPRKDAVPTVEEFLDYNVKMVQEYKCK